MRTVTTLDQRLTRSERARRDALLLAFREMVLADVVAAEALEGGIVKTVSNFKDIGERIVIYHMVRLVAGQVLDLRTAFSEAEVLHQRSMVARKLWDSREVMRRAVAQATPKQSAMTDDEFERRFQPRFNPINADAAFDGKMFETYGPELLLVKQENPACVWTLLDCDGELVLSSGFHYVNRIGYLICKVPVEDGAMYEVAL